MTDTRSRTTLGTWFRFLVRTVGLTGFLASFAGTAMILADYRLSALPGHSIWQHQYRLVAAVVGGDATPYEQTAVWLAVAGGLAIIVALAVELIHLVLLLTGRRTAAGASTTVAVVAAVALLILVNAYSFTHHVRFDFTRDRHLTLPAAVADDLRKLRPDVPTTIVVFQQHKTFGTLSGKPDGYDYAAERKVVEKVRDLVDLFREFGPRFNVVVLDVEDENYEKRVAELTNDSPELKAALDAAEENSIFFAANKRVQRLAFNEFMHLDKTGSKEANGGRGNLVLLPQGVERFARRVLAVHERRPRAAVCVVHPALGTDIDAGRESLGTAGLKKALGNHGFDVIDVVLKKNWEDDSKDLEPAALTARESKLEQAEADFVAATDRVRGARAERQVLDAVGERLDRAKTESFRDRGELYNQLGQVAREEQWLELVAAYRKWSESDRPLSPETEGEFRAALLAALAEQKRRADDQVATAEKERAAAEDKYKAALADDRSAEDRRIPEVKAKLTRLLADVDLLILPRVTMMNATTGAGINPALHALHKDQVEAVKEFMKAGKPVLACLGPVSGPTGPRPDGGDEFDRLLADRGIELGRETILFDAEGRALAGRRSGAQLGGAGDSDIPPLVVIDTSPVAPEKPANPVGAALRLTGRSVEQQLDLRLRAPRPVYLLPGWEGKLPFVAEFVLTTEHAWNEEMPFARADQRGRITYLPEYRRTPTTDPKWGTHAAERKGPFPIGVAVESRVPAAWFNEAYDREQRAAALLVPIDGVLAAGLTVAANQLDRPTQRLVVFGSGNLFAGAELKPAQEQLLLHSVNWLTERTDRLPRAELPAWQYPRVEMSERNLTLWRLGTAVGLPLVAVYLGLMAMLVRRLR